MSKPEVGAVTGDPRFTYAPKRRAWRFKPEQVDEAFVELAFADGSQWHLSLVVIGAGGFGFSLIDGRPAIAVGDRIGAVTIQVGGLRITGSIRVVHVNETFAADTICGAEFTPATETDMRKMAYLVNQLEKRNQRSG